MESSSRFKLKIFIPIILLVIIVIAGVLLYSKLSAQTASKSRNIVAIKTIVDPKRKMEQQVKAALTSTEDKNIISFLNLASTEKDPVKRYQYYVKTYAQIIVNYNKSNAFEKLSKKPALIALKSYVATLAGYKESDFVMPK